MQLADSLNFEVGTSEKGLVLLPSYKTYKLVPSCLQSAPSAQMSASGIDRSQSDQFVHLAFADEISKPKSRSKKQKKNNINNHSNHNNINNYNNNYNNNNNKQAKNKHRLAENKQVRANNTCRCIEGSAAFPPSDAHQKDVAGVWVCLSHCYTPPSKRYTRKICNKIWALNSGQKKS